MSFCSPVYPQATKSGDVLKFGSITLEEETMNEHVNPVMRGILNSHAAIIPTFQTLYCLFCGGTKDVNPSAPGTSYGICLDCWNKQTKTS